MSGMTQKAPEQLAPFYSLSLLLANPAVKDLDAGPLKGTGQKEKGKRKIAPRTEAFSAESVLAL